MKEEDKVKFAQDMMNVLGDTKLDTEDVKSWIPNILVQLSIQETWINILMRHLNIPGFPFSKSDLHKVKMEMLDQFKLENP